MNPPIMQFHHPRSPTFVIQTLTLQHGGINQDINAMICGHANAPIPLQQPATLIWGTLPWQRITGIITQIKCVNLATPTQCGAYRLRLQSALSLLKQYCLNTLAPKKTVIEHINTVFKCYLPSETLHWLDTPSSQTHGGYRWQYNAWQWLQECLSISSCMLVRQPLTQAGQSQWTISQSFDNWPCIQTHHLTQPMAALLKHQTSEKNTAFLTQISSPHTAPIKVGDMIQIENNTYRVINWRACWRPVSHPRDYTAPLETETTYTLIPSNEQCYRTAYQQKPAQRLFFQQPCRAIIVNESPDKNGAYHVAIDRLHRKHYLYAPCLQPDARPPNRQKLAQGIHLCRHQYASVTLQWENGNPNHPIITGSWPQKNTDKKPPDAWVATNEAIRWTLTPAKQTWHYYQSQLYLSEHTAQTTITQRADIISTHATDHISHQAKHVIQNTQLCTQKFKTYRTESTNIKLQYQSATHQSHLCHWRASQRFEMYATHWQHTTHTAILQSKTLKGDINRNSWQSHLATYQAPEQIWQCGNQILSMKNGNISISGTLNITADNITLTGYPT